MSQTEPVHFEPNAEGRSIERGQGAAVIRPLSRTRYAVTLCDSGRSHVVTLVDDGKNYQGDCSCDGYRFHSGPCAHLWAVKFGADRNAVEICSPTDALRDTGMCPRCGTEHVEEAE